MVGNLQNSPTRSQCQSETVGPVDIPRNGRTQSPKDVDYFNVRQTVPVGIPRKCEGYYTFQDCGTCQASRAGMQNQ